MLKQIAADNNIRVGGSLFSDSLGDKDSKASTYLDMLRFNTETIVEALAREKDEQLAANQTTQEAPLAKIFVIIGAVMLLVLGFFISKRIA